MQNIETMNYTRKRLVMIPIERNCQPIIEQRTEFCRYVEHISDDNLIYLDEFGVNGHCVCSYGYSPINSKCGDPKRRGKFGIIKNKIQSKSNQLLNQQTNQHPTLPNKHRFYNSEQFKYVYIINISFDYYIFHLLLTVNIYYYVNSYCCIL